MASTIHSVVLSDSLQTGPTSQGFWCKVACLIVKVITWYVLAIGIFRNELDEKHNKWNQMFIIKCSGSFTDPCMECKSFYVVIVLNLRLLWFNSVNKYIMLLRILERATPFLIFLKIVGQVFLSLSLIYEDNFSFFLIFLDNIFFEKTMYIWFLYVIYFFYKVLIILELNRTIIGSVRKIPLMIKYENLSCE